MAAETLGPEPMIATAEAAGFNSEVPLDLPRPAESRYPTDFGALISRPEATAPIYENSAKLAQTGIGAGGTGLGTFKTGINALNQSLGIYLYFKGMGLQHGFSLTHQVNLRSCYLSGV